MATEAWGRLQSVLVEAGITHRLRALDMKRPASVNADEAEALRQQSRNLSHTDEASSTLPFVSLAVALCLELMS